MVKPSQIVYIKFNIKNLQLSLVVNRWINNTSIERTRENKEQTNGYKDGLNGFTRVTTLFNIYKIRVG